MHQYFDNDYSGSHNECVHGAETLHDATLWLRKNSKKAFLGEIGLPNNPDCISTLKKVLGFLDANSDVWLGWAAWVSK